MKIIAFYLPQYHSIPENDAWWGEGFTEWTNVKKTKPLFNNHVQPKEPLNDNYYCLLDDEIKIWQAKIAKESGIYGFCYYHYWFNGKMLLEKPAQQMLQNTKIDISFCFSWANEPWTRSWKGDNKNILIEQSYGGKEDWKKHFEYLLPFFKDTRYIKNNGKPMFMIYKPDIIPQCYAMMNYWNELAISHNFPGIYFGCQFPSTFQNRENEKRFDMAIEFEPLYTRMEEQDFINITQFTGRIKVAIKHPIIFAELMFNIVKNRCLQKPVIYDYPKTCEKIVSRKPRFSNAVPGIFTSWDKTPRNGSKATIYKNSTPKVFGETLKKQINRAEKIYNSEYLFITAWNEWGEGAYLEPDKQYGYEYLDVINNCK